MGRRNRTMDSEEYSYKLVAPDIDRLIRIFPRNWKNAEKPSAKLLEATNPLFEAMRDLKPIPENDEVKQIWISVPRGTIEDYGDYESAREDGEVESYEEFEESWREWYPEEEKWYCVTVAEQNNDRYKFRCVTVEEYYIVSADYRDGFVKYEAYDEEFAEKLLPLLTEAVSRSMDMLRAGTYNEYVEKNIHYQHRTGVIHRADLWKAFPEEKEAIFEGLSQGVFEKFQEYLLNNDEGKIGRMDSFTANDFFHACEIGYRSCGYDCGDMTPDQMYLRFADGRDEGLTGKGNGLHAGSGIAFDDPIAWDEWYFDRTRMGGHPWEVCSGGNSTHINLYVRHDKGHLDYLHYLGKLSDEEYEEAQKGMGYYFEVAGKAWNRAVEAVNFFVSIRDAGYPVVLAAGEEILRRFRGEDFVGIVPWRYTPVYCESMFPREYGPVIDFTHVFSEEYEELKDKITWLPMETALLCNPE